MSRISVIGGGYVGLVTGAGLARLGHSVVIVEVDQHRLSRIRSGQLPIHEPGLDEMVAEERAEHRLEFTDDYAAAIPSSDFVFLAVNTPPRPDGEADTTFVFNAVGTVLAHARPGLTIVTKSTVPVGTGDQIEALARESGNRVEVVSNPEFLREGTAVYDFMHPDRVVVGSRSEASGARVAGLYEALDAKVILTSRRSAELAKYAANAFLATRISFMNEIATISEAVGADIAEIERVVGADNRIGPAFLQAGLGWGGSCFPKDLSALAATASRAGLGSRIIDAVVEVNAGQRERAIELLLEAVAGRTDGVVGVFGLAFKPHTDDLRGAPSLEVIDRLLAAGVGVRAHDPAAMPAARVLLPGAHYARDPYEVAEGADALLLATEWPLYRELDWRRLRSLMRGRRIVDGRNVLHGGLLARLGFDYRSFGRPAVSAATPVDRAAAGRAASGTARDHDRERAGLRTDVEAAADRVA